MRKLSQLLIKDIYAIDENPPIVVSQDDEFADVITLFADSSELRGIFVTDHGNHFVGVITRPDMLDWVRVQVGDFFGGVDRGPEKSIRFYRIIRATTVADVMNPDSVTAAVSLEDTAKDAMRKMVELDTIVVPVIDNDNQIIGDIKLSEILTASLESD